LGGGTDAGALYANWQFNQPKAVLLEDAYVNNNGILYGGPGFADDGEHHYVQFNGAEVRLSHHRGLGHQDPGGGGW